MRRGIIGLVLSAALALPLAANAAMWTFAGALNADQEIPVPTLPPIYFGGGLLTSTLDDVTGDFSLSVFFSGLTAAPVAAHIHVGPPGVAGPIVVDLGSPTIFFPGIGEYSFSTTLGALEIDTLTGGGALLVGDATIAYVNIHTPDNPSGEIRGQLIVSSVPIPAAVWLMGSALVACSTLRRRV